MTVSSQDSHFVIPTEWLFLFSKPETKICTHAIFFVTLRTFLELV